jgi:hypothetical protein
MSQNQHYISLIYFMSITQTNFPRPWSSPLKIGLFTDTQSVKFHFCEQTIVDNSLLSKNYTAEFVCAEMHQLLQIKTLFQILYDNQPHSQYR